MTGRAVWAKNQLMYPRADPRNARPLSQQWTGRAARTDSKVDLDPPVVPQGHLTRSQELSILSALPASVISHIYASKAFARQEPIDFPRYLGAHDFEFDLRTKHGLSAFKDWREALAFQAWSVRSLTIKHWTTWWGFGDNKWTSSEDKTHFSRGSSGELIISRAISTPETETCKCSMAQLLTQVDPSFDLQQYHAITNMAQFVDHVRAPEREANKPTLVDAASIFAKLLQEHSKHLAKYYGLAGSQCVGCDMPSVYLCGHLSTKAEKDGVELEFDASAQVVRASTSVREVMHDKPTHDGLDRSHVSDWVDGVETPALQRKPSTAGP